MGKFGWGNFHAKSKAMAVRDADTSWQPANCPNSPPLIWVIVLLRGIEIKRLQSEERNQEQQVYRQLLTGKSAKKLEKQRQKIGF